MQKAELDAFKRQLEERRLEIIRQLENYGEAMSYLEESRPPELSEEAQEEAAANSLKALDEQERRELTAISLGLDKIEDGTYGLCESCSRDISMARLKALPMVQFCISCQTKMEKK